jgi:hypothetical protein
MRASDYEKVPFESALPAHNISTTSTMIKFSIFYALINTFAKATKASSQAIAALFDSAKFPGALVTGYVTTKAVA